MNQVVKKGPAGPIVVSKVWDDVPMSNDDLMAGVAISFPMLVLGAREWVVRWKGEDQVVKIPNTDYPAPFVDVVILNAQKEMSRVFYIDPYQQGSRGKKPDCWSSNGIKPDDMVANPVNPICATCPNDAWGSGGSPAAPKAKACLQRRRTVVVPYIQDGDLTNEAGGGPMLLSVPPGSLQNQVKYGSDLNELGVFYSAAVTRLSFESGAKFPKIQFEILKTLDDAESAVVKEVRVSKSVETILNSKINIDGGEVDPNDNAGATGNTQVNIPKTPPVGAGAAKPAAQTAQPAKITQAATQPAKAQPSPSASQVRVGGHAIGGTIAEAVAKPATPPQSQRTVVTETTVHHMPPAAEEEPTDEDAEAKAPMPTTSMFDDLMNRE